MKQQEKVPLNSCCNNHMTSIHIKKTSNRITKTVLSIMLILILAICVIILTTQINCKLIFLHGSCWFIRSRFSAVYGSVLPPTCSLQAFNNDPKLIFTVKIL